MTETEISDPSVLDYNTLPYQSVPYPYTRPSFLGGMAQVFGLTPPDPTTARVLELGCASGGNILPLALQNPGARIVGIDLAEAQVTTAQQRIEQLGLNNITVEQADIATYTAEPESFDYVICHGVYSWVPDAAREAILRLAAHALRPNGVLYVSYNVNPGWRMRSVIRDLCLLHAGTHKSPELRVARARWALDQIAAVSDEGTPYGQLLRREAAQCAKLPDSYILGEFLAKYNTPCTITEFAGAAATHGLVYLCETEIATSLPEAISNDTGALIRKIAGDSSIALEQYIDYFAGRQFRRSLLVKRDVMGQVSRRLTAQSLEGLHLSCPVVKGPPNADSDVPTYRVGRQTLPATEAGLRRVLDHLAEITPDSFTLDGLVAHLGGAGTDHAALKAQLAAVMLRLWHAGALTVSAAPVRVGRVTETPCVWPLARLEAQEGQSWVTTQTHTAVPASETLRAMILTCDGRTTIDTLANRLKAAATPAGTSQTNAPVAPPPTRDSLSRYLDQMARAGLLV